MNQESSHEIRKEVRNKLSDELKNTFKYHKYINSRLLMDVCKRQDFYGVLQRPDKYFRRFDKNGWVDLYKTEPDHWRIQRYKNSNYCRIRDWHGKSQTYGTVKQIIYPILNECRRQAHLEKIPQKDWGIVFCGGGGKGAYQIGVWQWLIDHGIADKITGVSGASVGALNSLLFTLGDIKKAYQVWGNVQDDDIVATKGGLPILFQSSRPIQEIIERNINNHEWERIYHTNKIIYSSLTGTNGLPLEAVIQCIKDGVTTTENGIRAEYLCWTSRSSEEIKQIVLSSAALPGLKKPRRFEGVWFIDGGVADNAPVRPLIEDGFQNIIVVGLGDKDYHFKKSIEGLATRNINFYHVHPSAPQALGPMAKANPELNNKRFAWGYGDADLQLRESLKHI